MRRPARILVTFGMDEYRVNDEGNPDSNGISNKEVGRWFCNQLRDIGGERVEVVVIEDPPTKRITEQVKRAIEEADAVVCIFGKRVMCQIERKWTTSQFVLSESGYAASRFRDEVDHRVFGFAEDGVDTERLGLAFPRDRTTYYFKRSQLAAVRPKLEQIVSTLVGASADFAPVEHQIFEKTVTVRTDGRVEVEARHRFRVRKKMMGFQMQHTLWRVRDNLPPFEDLITGIPGKQEYYLKCVLLQVGRANPDEVQIHLSPAVRAAKTKAILFSIEIPKQSLEAGDIVEYTFAWSYPNAFLPAEQLEPWELNSAGLRAGSSGPVGQVALRLLFERIWFQHDVFPSIELPNDATGPQVLISMENTLPNAVDPRDFWHRKGQWSPADFMQRVRDAQHPLFEVYEWHAKNFTGFVKAVWQPAANFYQPRSERADDAELQPDEPEGNASAA